MRPERQLTTLLSHFAPRPLERHPGSERGHHQVGLDADAYNDSDVFTFPNGCHAAEVEIDPETGTVTLERYNAIDDYGA